MAERWAPRHQTYRPRGRPELEELSPDCAESQRVGVNRELGRDPLWQEELEQIPPKQRVLGLDQRWAEPVESWVEGPAPRPKMTESWAGDRV